MTYERSERFLKSCWQARCQKCGELCWEDGLRMWQGRMLGECCLEDVFDYDTLEQFDFDCLAAYDNLDE